MSKVKVHNQRLAGKESTSSHGKIKWDEQGFAEVSEEHAEHLMAIPGYAKVGEDGKLIHAVAPAAAAPVNTGNRKEDAGKLGEALRQLEEAQKEAREHRRKATAFEKKVEEQATHIANLEGEKKALEEKLAKGGSGEDAEYAAELEKENAALKKQVEELKKSAPKAQGGKSA